MASLEIPGSDTTSGHKHILSVSPVRATETENEVCQQQLHDVFVASAINILNGTASMHETALPETSSDRFPSTCFTVAISLARESVFPIRTSSALRGGHTPLSELHTTSSKTEGNLLATDISTSDDPTTVCAFTEDATAILHCLNNTAWRRINRRSGQQVKRDTMTSIISNTTSATQQARPPYQSPPTPVARFIPGDSAATTPHAPSRVVVGDTEVDPPPTPPVPPAPGARVTAEAQPTAEASPRIEAMSMFEAPLTPEAPPTPEASPIPEAPPTPEASPIPEASPTPEASPIHEASPIPEARLTAAAGSLSPEAPPVPEATSAPEALPISETGSTGDARSTAGVVAATEEAGGEIAATGEGAGKHECGLGECLYVGQDCFFLELPDGTLACVAGLENLPAPPPGAEDAGNNEDRPGEQMTLARLQCHNCLQLLEFDSRAYFVQCSSCLTLNAVQNQANSLRGGRAMIVICGRCSTRNISCLGSVYVECWQCHTVCQVDYPTPAAAAGLVNEQDTSAAANAAAAAAGAGQNIDTPTGGRLRPATPANRRAGFLFASSATRRRLRVGRQTSGGLAHLHRRVRSSGMRRSRQEEEEEENDVNCTSAVSRDRRERDDTRVSTAVQLPRALSSQCHARGGRSLPARHSFNPLPPRTIRLRVGGNSDNASNRRSSNYRETAFSEDMAATTTHETSCSSTYTRERRRQQRQRLRWRTRPETAPPAQQQNGDADTINGSRSLSALLRLPFRRSDTTAHSRADTAAAISGAYRERDTGGTREILKQAVQSLRGHRDRRARERRCSPGGSDSDSLARGESDADEHLSSGTAATTARCRRMREAQETDTDRDRMAVTFLPGGGIARRRRGREETVDETKEGGRRAGEQALDRRRCDSDGEQGGSGGASGESLGSFLPFSLNAENIERRREAAARDIFLTPREVQHGNSDTTCSFPPPASFPSSSSRTADIPEKSVSGLDVSPPLTRPSAENVSYVSEASCNGRTAPAGVDPVVPRAASRHNRILSTRRSAAPATAQNEAATQRAVTAQTSAGVELNNDTHTNRDLRIDVTPDETAALRRSSWREAFRQWRTHEREEVPSRRRFRYVVPRSRGAATVP